MGHSKLCSATYFFLISEVAARPILASHNTHADAVLSFRSSLPSAIKIKKPTRREIDAIAVAALYVKLRGGVNIIVYEAIVYSDE